MVFNKTKLHQFGSFVFNQEESSLNLNYGFKTQLDSSVAIDGSIRNNGISQDKKDDYNLSFDISFTNLDDFNHFKSLINSGIQKLWIKRKVYDKIDCLWQWATVTRFSESFKESNDTFDGTSFFTFQVEFRLLETYWRLEKEPFYFDYSNIQRNQYDKGLKFDAGNKYDSHIAGAINYNIPDIWECESNKIELQNFDYYYNLEKNPQIKNLLSFSNNFTNAVWVKNNISISLNSVNDQNFNLLSPNITVAGSNPNLSQIVSSIKDKITYQFDIKQGTVGNATHFIIDQTNATDGLASSGLIAISSGLPVGNGFYRHSFSRISTIDTNNTLSIRFRTSTNTDPSINSTISVNNNIAYNYYQNNNIVLPAHNLDNQTDLNFDSRNALSLVLNSNNIFYANTNQFLVSQNKTSPLVSILINNLASGDTISLINQSNRSGFKLTWLNGNSGKIIVYPNQFKVYQNNNLLNPINLDYKIENITGFNLGLTFNSKSDYNTTISQDIIDRLQIQKTSGSDISILINYNQISH